MNKLTRLFATLGPIGYLPASGTIASGIIFIAGYLLQTNQPFNGWTILVVIAMLTYCTYHYSRTCTETDPRQIVSDEIIASLLLVWLIPHSAFYLLLTFGLWRYFDITKPFGIKRVEKLSGVYGIITDDLLAAFYTLGIIRIIQFIS